MDGDIRNGCNHAVVPSFGGFEDLYGPVGIFQAHSAHCTVLWLGSGIKIIDPWSIIVLILKIAALRASDNIRQTNRPSRRGPRHGPRPTSFFPSPHLFRPAAVCSHLSISQRARVQPRATMPDTTPNVQRRKPRKSRGRGLRTVNGWLV